ncbi:hypothetical protein ACSNOH_13265 [Streptomyces sp. URMC 127]|uniref:hypothetical protein n=1 Tax=Streptomyces sp. URMC 127 TaxID=3423402 RepID=UPI003F1A55F5
MPVTITAHQLGRLIDRTISNMDGEFTAVLHGIRLEADAEWLYAVASDRYTVAAARYRHDGLEGEPFARTLPAGAVRALQEWTSAQPGHSPVTVTAEGGRVRVTAAHSDLGIAVDPSADFFDWRGVLRGVIEQTSVPGNVFPVLNTRLLERFGAAGPLVRVRATADQNAVLIAGQDFLGALMPVRVRGMDSDGLGTLDQTQAAWQDTLSTGGTATMPDNIPARQHRPRHEITKDLAETAGDLLKQTLRSTHDALASTTSDEAFAAYATASVTAWRAYRYLDALHTADPRLAATIVAETAEELDSGEISEFAWEAARKAGHDPAAWSQELEDRLANALTSAPGQPAQEAAVNTSEAGSTT